ncbi:hypothetical protein [Streptomyces sp. SLBN-118]|uniref:hypothetical protein n=1 Tax=Streptomyces sp. SLBN-118 TaxID=2768454 RepID=UPI0021B3BCD5|nr:hypothetical protein [Streptomyces sp. SLBN-118]
MGFGSQSYADVVRDLVAPEHREAHLAMIGDFDCSGEDIERDWVERTGCWSSVTRVLLTYEQVRAYGPRRPRESAATRVGWASPAATVSTSSTRCSGRWRRWSRPELRRLVLAAVDPCVDRAVLA